MESHKTRIIGGALGGRIIMTPVTSRPTTCATREMIFNVLVHRFLVDFNSVFAIDICAGSGSLGIEAISMGCQHCTFIENDANAVGCIRTNLEKLEVPNDKFKIIKTDSTSICDKMFESYRENKTIIFVDPPYKNKILLFSILELLNSFRLKMLCVVESDVRLDLRGSLEKKQGKRTVTFLDSR